jgi:membrane protease YdiL (CAAX protease family)
LKKELKQQLEPQKVQPSKLWSPPLMVILTVGLFFVAQFLASAIFIFIALGAGWSDKQLNDWFKSSTLVQFGYVLLTNSIIVAGIWQLLKAKKMSFKSIGWRRPIPKDFAMALVGYGGYFVLFIAITAIAKLLVPSLDLQQEQQLGFKPEQTTGISLAFAAISLVVLPPIVEELLTRGFLFTGLRQKLNLVWSAIITSLVFAAAHLQFGGNTPLLWVAALDTFALSLVLVYLRERTGGLAAPILLHGLKNLIAFSLLFIFKV